MTKIHWSDIEMYNDSLSVVVAESPSDMRRYLQEFHDYGSVNRDGYYLVVQIDGELVYVEGEDFDFGDIDWTDFGEE